MTPPVAFRGAASVLVVQDVARSVEHYRDVLGFRVEFTYGDPAIYAGVVRDNVLIHLQAARETKRQPGHSSIDIFVTDVDTLHAELAARGARTRSAPQDYDYGMRDFAVEDLDGNHLAFGTESPTR